MPKRDEAGLSSSHAQQQPVGEKELQYDTYAAKVDFVI